MTRIPSTGSVGPMMWTGLGLAVATPVVDAVEWVWLETDPGAWPGCVSANERLLLVCGVVACLPGLAGLLVARVAARRPVPSGRQRVITLVTMVSCSSVLLTCAVVVVGLMMASQFGDDLGALPLCR